MEFANCFTYAWRMWRYAKKDHLVIRKSHWGWFPHFSVIVELQDGSLVKKEYVPVTPEKHRFPPLFFKGEIRTTYYTKDDTK